MINRLKSLGPGLLYAGAAIGVSHIVQSTRAGAEYGYILIIAIILAHIFKYPFFAVGPRYVNLTGQNLIQAYTRMSKHNLWIVLLLTLSTMFTIQAAVTVVTAGLAQKITGLAFSPWLWSSILLLICFCVLQIGKFNVLDHFMKVIMIILALSTVMAVVFSFQVEKDSISSITKIFSFSNNDDVGFLVAFIGWMPAPLDIAIWHSIWTAAKYAAKGRNELEAENFDFKVGFYGTAFLAICFVVLGANTLYGTGNVLESSAAKFASQLIDIYTNSLGSWSYYIILIAAFTTMFSTTLTCFDAIPRVMKTIVEETKIPKYNWLKTTWLWMLVLASGSILILAFFVANMKQMVTIATVVSFVTAPILAYLSYRLVLKSEFRNQIWSNVESKLAFVGLIFLSLFSIYYLINLL